MCYLVNVEYERDNCNCGVQKYDNSGSVPELEPDMQCSKQEHDQYRDSGRMKRQATCQVALKQGYKAALHTTTRAVDMQQCL